MTNSIFASLRETFLSSDFTLTASSGGSTTTNRNLYYWVNGFSRGGMNLLTSMGQVAVNAGQKLVWTITAKPVGDDIFGWILSASTTNDQTTAKILAVADARDINQETILSLPITVELTHDSHFGLGVTGALPTSNKLNGMIRYASGHYQQYVAQLDEWQIVNGWNAYIASTITPLSTGVYKNGCDVPILSNESIIDLPDYEGGTSTRFRLSLLNGLTEGSGNLLPVGSKIVLNVLLDNNDAIAADYLNGKIQISPVHKKRRLDGSITALSPGTVTWEWGKPFYTLTSNLERGYSLEFDVTVVNATLPQGATLTFYLSDYGRISERMPSNGAGSMVWASGDRARLYPMQSGVLRGTGSGVIEVTGETYSYPFNCAIRESYAFGLQSNTANQLAAISGLTNGEINFRANENALLATEKVRAVVSTQAVTLTPSDWVSIGSVSANQLINVTVNYPCDANGIGTIRANYPDIIAGSAIGEFNVDKLRVFLRENGTTITETTPVTVVPGESQTFTITAIGSSATLPTPTAPNLGFYTYGDIETTTSGNSSNLTAGTYEICIAYQYEGEKVVAISHSTSDGAIGENTLTNDQVFGSQAYFNVEQIRNIPDPYDGQTAACLTTKVVYVYFSTSTGSDDGVDTLEPVSGTGRWLNVARNALTDVSYIEISTVNPTVNDDESQGYSIGYSWVNTATGQQFTLQDNTEGAAVWNEIPNTATLGTAALKDTGTAIGNVIELEDVGGQPKLPAVDGSQLTNLPSGGHVIEDDGTPVTQRGNLNFVGATITDDSGNDRTTIEFVAGSLLPDQTGNTGKYLSTNGTVASWEDIPQSGHTIENEGSPLSQRTKLNFIGSAVNVIDNSGDDATEVTINLPETGAGLNLGTWDDSGTFTTGVNFDGNDAKLLIPAVDTATRTSSTPVEKELLFDTDLNEVYYGDGTTQGGIKLAKSTDISNGLTLDLISEPLTPDTGKLIIYASALDGLIYKKDDQGVVTEIGTGGSGGSGGGVSDFTVLTNNVSFTDSNNYLVPATDLSADITIDVSGTASAQGKTIEICNENTLYKPCIVGASTLNGTSIIANKGIYVPVSGKKGKFLITTNAKDIRQLWGDTVVIDWIPGYTPPFQTFTYTSPGDTNGIIFYLGATKYNTSFQNPHDRGEVTASASSDIDGIRMASGALTRSNTGDGARTVWHSTSGSNHWWRIEFNNGQTARINRFELWASSDHSLTSFFGSATFQAWNGTQWITLLNFTASGTNSARWLSPEINNINFYSSYRFSIPNLQFAVIGDVEFYGDLQS